MIAAEREQEQTVAHDVGDLLELARPEDVCRALDVRRAAGDFGDIGAELVDVGLPVAQVDHLVDEPDQL